jgi:hypothetical protein
MTLDEASLILDSLANGLVPFTDEPIHTGSIIHDPKVVRALFAAVRLMQRELDGACVQQSARPDSRPKASRAGQPWTPSEDSEFADSFRQGHSFETIASSHERSKGAIISRLVKLGEIEPKQSENATSVVGTSANE